jgi:hypothetical protein
VAFGDAAGRQAVSVMEEAVWRPPIDTPGFHRELAEFHETAVFYSQLYGQEKHHNTRRIERENWLFYGFYQLYEEIKGGPPGIAGPLYRFTMEGAKQLSIKINITEEAFYMRMRRVLNKQHKKFGSLATLASLCCEPDAGRDATSEIGSLGAVL